MNGVKGLRRGGGDENREKILIKPGKEATSEECIGEGIFFPSLRKSGMPWIFIYGILARSSPVA